MDMFFFKERKSPDIPENISDHKCNTETTDSAFLDQEQPKKRAKTKKDTRTSYQKYLHWQKSRPNTCTITRNVFSKLYFEQSARYINSHLERQSDRDIPKLSRTIHHPFLLKFNSLLHHQMVYGL